MHCMACVGARHCTLCVIVVLGSRSAVTKTLDDSDEVSEELGLLPTTAAAAKALSSNGAISRGAISRDAPSTADRRENVAVLSITRLDAGGIKRSRQLH